MSKKKNLKPFKVGATYKLRKKYAKKYFNTYFWTQYHQEKFGTDDMIFVVVNIDEHGDVFTDTTCGNGCFPVSQPVTRYMFKRVDNK